MPPGKVFIPRRTTRLLPGGFENIDVIRIAKSLEHEKKNITGIQPRFGGKAFDITWKDEGSAVKAISSGIDIDGSHFDLRLLGFKSLDVSIFVACEFPDEALKELLRNYGDFNENKIRRLHLKEPGFEHIENGVRVVTFSRISRDLPHTLVYQSTPLGFRYTGQPKLCFKCASPDHMVRDCPKNKVQTPETTPPQPQAPQQQESTKQIELLEYATDSDSHYETDRISTSEGESDMETDDETTMEFTNDKKKTTKRTRPGNSDTENPNPSKHPAPAQTETSDETSPINHTPELFTAPSTSTITETERDNQPTPSQKAKTGSRLHKFVKAMRSQCSARQRLIRKLKSGNLYYQARGLWLQHVYGDYSPALAQKNRCINDRENAEWIKAKGQIQQDAYANLLHLYSDIIKTVDIFPSTSE